MSLRKYDNSNSPRLVTVLNDGGTIPENTVSGQSVVVFGFAKVGLDADGEKLVPTQELFPSRAGSLTIAELIDLTKNVSEDTNPVKYPSEVSIALEQLQAKAVQNVQVVLLGDDARLRDVTARMARERYIALENAYDLIDSNPIDQIRVCGAVMGLKGDGLYNASTQEVVYDPEAAAEVGADLSLSSVSGFLVSASTDNEKDAVTEPEDLAYQLAAICHKVSVNGTMCRGVMQTLSPMDVKYLKSLDVVGVGQAGTTYGSAGTAATSTAAGTWALYSSSYFSDWDFAVDHANVSGDDVLSHIERAAYVVDRSTNAAVAYANGSTQTVKPSFTSLKRPTTFLTEANDNSTVPSSKELDIVSWDLLFGKATPSEVKSWERFLKGYGNGTATVFKNNVASYLAWDGTTADSQGQPQFYRFYATQDSEMPLSANDADVVKDDNGRAQDIGIYLTVIASNSRYTGPSVALLDPANGLSKSFVVSGAEEYLGLSSLIPSSIAHTRQLVTTVEPLAFISSRSVSDLTRLRYVVYKEEDGDYLINRDITGGMYVSETVRTDFVNELTFRIVKDAMDIVRLEGKPILGTVGNPIRIEGFKQTLEQELSRWANPEDGRLTRIPSIDVSTDLRSGFVGRILVVLGLPVAGEILEIRTVVNLQN